MNKNELRPGRRAPETRAESGDRRFVTVVSLEHSPPSHMQVAFTAADWQDSAGEQFIFLHVYVSRPSLETSASAADRAWLYHAWERPCEPGLRDCKSVMLFSDRVQTRCDDGLSRRKDVPAAFSCAKPWPQSCDGRAAGVAGQARVSCGYRLVAAAGPLL